MKLSVIIVSYNVSAFLENCLQSVYKALKGIESEVWVVDNHSVDHTLHMVRSKFPLVQLIENKENRGFAVANNQAIKRSSGEYILLLNPDTIVSEDCFVKCISFLDKNQQCGAVGVKMFDGTGAFLPESKRGFPSPFASFSKMTGLYRLFPKSKLWNQYYLGHISENQIHEVDVLTGAFFFIRSSVFDQIDPLDEAFFMYGEDIDLSYRIKQAGFSIYYFPQTSIIHFKGESTKKGSLDYVRTFYQAMIIFSRKHFKGTRSWLLIQILKIGIYFAAISSYISKRVKALIPFCIDLILIILSIFLATILWSRFYYENPHHFDQNFYLINLPLYSFIMASSLHFRGAYHQYVNWRGLFMGVFWGILATLIVYALLPLNLRSSRIVILLFVVFFLGLSSLVRFVYERMVNKNGVRGRARRVVFVGRQEEYARVRELINRSTQSIQMFGAISVEKNFNPDLYFNHISELEEVTRIYQIDEIIFSADSIDIATITKWMTQIGSKIDYKISSQQSSQIIGSASKNMAGEFYGIDIAFKIDDPFVRRSKRTLDLVLSVILFFLSPILIFKWKNPILFFVNLFGVICGKLSWVGYHRSDQLLSELPAIRPGVIQITGNMSHQGLGISTGMTYVHNFNYLYAKDYRIAFDIDQITQHFSHLDQSTTHDKS